MIDEQMELEEETTGDGMREALEEAIGGKSDLDTFDTPLEAHDTADEAPADEAPAEETADADTEGTATIAAAGASKAPLDWAPGVREKWKDLPKDVQDHITARDTHVNTMLQEGAQSRKMGEGLLNIAEPYRAIMQAEGVSNPLQAVEGLFKSVATLRMGSPQDKANLIAQFVNAYGVDITALDNALVGNTQATQADPMEAMLEKRMGPVNELLAQIQRGREATQVRQTQEVQQDIGAFAQTAEFFNDVRDDMADFLESAGRRNVSMTLQQAYDKACALNTEISGVMSSRAAQQALMGGRNNIAAKRNAASSVSGGSGGGATGGGNMGLRGALNAAFQEHA
jgi:hypothetical protein